MTGGLWCLPPLPLPPPPTCLRRCRCPVAAKPLLVYKLWPSPLAAAPPDGRPNKPPALPMPPLPLLPGANPQVDPGLESSALEPWSLPPPAAAGCLPSPAPPTPPLDSCCVACEEGVPPREDRPPPPPLREEGVTVAVAVVDVGVPSVPLKQSYPSTPLPSSSRLGLLSSLLQLPLLLPSELPKFHPSHA